MLWECVLDSPDVQPLQQPDWLPGLLLFDLSVSATISTVQSQHFRLTLNHYRSTADNLTLILENTGLWLSTELLFIEAYLY